MFSVVIPVFNHERYLRRCVVSAVESPLVSEVLLLDDGSSDDSYQLVRALAGGALGKVRDVTPPARVNRGAHTALNALVEQARSEWIAVLNSDDLFIANRFEMIARTLRRDSADLVFGDLAVIDATGRQLGRKRGAFDPQLPFPAEFDVPAMARAGNWLDLLSHQNLVATTSNMVFRKSLFQRIGGFADYRYIHDWDFMLRAALLGRVSYLPHPLTAYRIHQANTIKESSDRVDTEVRDMFARLPAKFPELAGRPLFQLGLAANPYLEHVAGAPLLSIIGPAAKFYDDTVLTGANGQYTYAPADPLHALTPLHLQNAMLALAFEDLDFVVVSHTLAEPPAVAIGELRDHAVFRASQGSVFLHGQSPARPLTGRALRLLPGDGRVQNFPFAVNAEFQTRKPAQLGVIRNPQTTSKPVVFVLPALFAVGGVERLTIDMMRHLSPQYDFVLITTERLSTGHGSLHGQTEGSPWASSIWPKQSRRHCFWTPCGNCAASTPPRWFGFATARPGSAITRRRFARCSQQSPSSINRPTTPKPDG